MPEYHDALWPPLPPNPPPALLATAHSVSQLPPASRPRPSTANRFRLRTSASAAALARPRTAGGGAAISPAVQKQLESLRASHSRLATLVAGPISPPRPATASRPLTAPAASRVDVEAAPEKVAYSAAELMATPLEASPLAEAAPPPHVSLEERVDATLRCMRASQTRMPKAVAPWAASRPPALAASRTQKMQPAAAAAAATVAEAAALTQRAYLRRSYLVLSDGWFDEWTGRDALGSIVLPRLVTALPPQARGRWSRRQTPREEESQRWHRRRRCTLPATGQTWYAP